MSDGGAAGRLAERVEEVMRAEREKKCHHRIGVTLEYDRGGKLRQRMTPGPVGMAGPSITEGRVANRLAVRRRRSRSLDAVSARCILEP